jgi:SAM-dependent methyltransferase
MTIFQKYAEYYDLFYQDKDYNEEANFIHKIIKKHHPAAKSILDMGCGTGNHDFRLYDKGYHIMGIDNSAANIKHSVSKLSLLCQKKNNIEFKKADARNVRLKRTFDVVISLFHVMSYQISNDDLSAVLQTVKLHLNPNGLFVFDCWYGPAVLTERPTVRIKKVDNQKINVKRVAIPKMVPSKNLVEINYHVEVQEKARMRLNKFREKHRMRYLFQPEVESFLKQVGLKLISCREWMTNNPPGFETWNVYFINKNIR